MFKLYEYLKKSMFILIMNNDVQELKNQIKILRNDVNMIKEDKKIIILLTIVLISNLFAPFVYNYLLKN